MLVISKSFALYFTEKSDNSGPNDFRFINSSQKINRENFDRVILPLKKITNNYTDFSYLDIGGVKFSFLNGNVHAVLTINPSASIPFTFEDGDTYGMAINIGDFSNPILPQMNEADYIYELQFKNKTWNELFGTQFENGEQKFILNKSIPQSDVGKFLDQNQHYLNLTFDTKLIDSPDQFQVKYFSLKEKGLNQTKYTLFDDIPWIEIPQAHQQVSLEPNVTVIYDKENLNGTIKVESSSRLAQNVFLTTNKICPEPTTTASLLVRQMRNIQFNELPGDDYCWSLVQSRQLEPPYNVASFPFVLKINRPTWPDQDVSLNVGYATADSFALPLPQEMRFHIKVGDWFYDRFYSVMNFLNNYNGAIGFIAGTVTVPIISRVGKLIAKHRKKTQSGDTRGSIKENKKTQSGNTKRSVRDSTSKER